MIETNRVMIDKYEATNPTRARKLGVSKSTIAFKRKDGWSLSASAPLERVAYKMWADEWTHFTRDFETWLPISEYKP